MDAGAQRRDDAPIPLDVTDDELEAAARACRALASLIGYLDRVRRIAKREK
jgi:hypothetical protein